MHRFEIGTRAGTAATPLVVARLDRVGTTGLARDYVKSHGRKAKDAMTRDLVSVSDTAELGDIATLLETKTTKRVPVDRDSKVIGIVSRANLVRALAAAGIRLTSDTAVDDRTLRQRLAAELKAQEWVHTWGADVIVREGAVHLWVSDDRPAEERTALRVAAENIPSVRSVEEHVVPVPMPSPTF